MTAPLASIVITIRNEAAHLPHLLRSIGAQELPFEVIVVDAGSTDGSTQILEAGRRQHAWLNVVVRPGCGRGEGRNIGAEAASGTILAFTDGDCVVDPQWLAALRRGLAAAPVVAGRTLHEGRGADLRRVELNYRGYDVTWPSCNLAYRAEAFRKLGGFDPDFITAEDIDLNLRAVEAGHAILHARDAIVRHQDRPTLGGFVRQAFWNGYGRHQLQRKHPYLPAPASRRRALATQWKPPAVMRLGAALAGYAYARSQRR